MEFAQTMGCQIRPSAAFCKGRFYHSAGLALHDLAVLKGMLSAALGGTHFK